MYNFFKRKGIVNLSTLEGERERYVACMVLGGVGDCLGFRNGQWEFELDGSKIHEQIQQLGGVEKLSVKGFKVSDDTIMLIATARALVMFDQEQEKEKRKPLGPQDHISEAIKALHMEMAAQYVECMKDMTGRAPGGTCIRGAQQLRLGDPNGYIIPFNPRGAGCGGAMRSMCIGLRYPREDDEPLLIAVSIESGRMTHNHPIGYLGSLVSAVFTAYAIRNVPVRLWATKFMYDILPKAREYVEAVGRDLEKTTEPWSVFENAWNAYIELRKLGDGATPTFPEPFGVAERDQYYRVISLGGWGGACGHDAPLIAYDALLGSKGDWSEFCRRGVFHGGDSDSTGTIGGCWFGAVYGFSTVPSSHYQSLEKLDVLSALGDDLHEIAKRAK